MFVTTKLLGPVRAVSAVVVFSLSCELLMRGIVVQKRKFCVSALVVVLGASGCSTYQVHSNLAPGTALAPTSASRVQVLYSPPQRPYEPVGIVSAKHYKPGWTDPSVSDAVPQLQAAGAQIGADAVIVRSGRALNDRHITVEAEAIRYTDKAAPKTQ